MKTLVTGSGGLVGSTIQADVKVSGRDSCDLSNYQEVFDLFTKEKPTHVIHCAGRVGGLKAHSDHLGEFFSENMIINLNVLEAARACGVKKVVSFLSTCVFPDSVDYPLTEEKIHSGEPHPSNYGYAYAKRMLEVQSRAYSDQYGMNCVCVIPTNIYGPNDNFNLDSSHVVPALIHKCYLAKRDNTDLVIWGSGEPLREFIFSEDVGSLVKSISEQQDSLESMIISNSQEITIKELVNTVVNALGFEGKVVYDNSKPDGQYRKPTDNQRLKNAFPKYEFTPLNVGIQKTVDWFISNYEKCRR
jgi:GDP-L-fucose synthase